MRGRRHFLKFPNGFLLNPLKKALLWYAYGGKGVWIEGVENGHKEISMSKYKTMVCMVWSRGGWQQQAL